MCVCVYSDVNNIIFEFLNGGEEKLGRKGREREGGGKGGIIPFREKRRRKKVFDGLDKREKEDREKETLGEGETITQNVRVLHTPLAHQYLFTFMW